MLLLGAVCRVPAQQLIYQEGFNDDGEAANPPAIHDDRAGVFEVPEIQSELGYFDQKGPLYWAHNFDVSYAGIPPFRRVALTVHLAGCDSGAATEDLLALFDSMVDWLLDGKANALDRG